MQITISQQNGYNFTLKFGTPYVILQDQGKGFKNNSLDELQNYFEIRKYDTAPLHPMYSGVGQGLSSTVF